jgi:ABC-type cobalamin/Fe3+-siderophores transport system ATPase subunit
MAGWGLACCLVYVRCTYRFSRTSQSVSRRRPEDDVNMGVESSESLSLRQTVDDSSSSQHYSVAHTSPFSDGIRVRTQPLKKMRESMMMRMNLLGAFKLVPALLLILDVTAFSSPGAVSPRRTFAVNTRLHDVRLSSVTSVSTKKKKNKNNNDDNEEQSTSPALPPALTLDALTCSHDGGTVYQMNDVSYVLPRTAKVGLVGRNGCGKSTLMKILAETCCTDRDPSSFSDQEGVMYTGRIECPKDIRVAFVEQEPPMPSGVTVADALLGVVSSSSDGQQKSGGGQSNSVFEVVRRYAHACSALEFDEDEFSAASTEMDSMDGWDVLTKADEIATRLRVDHLKDMPLSKLSGGERKRVALGAALVQSPDVLLLDEPVRSKKSPSTEPTAAPTHP